MVLLFFWERNAIIQPILFSFRSFCAADERTNGQNIDVRQCMPFMSFYPGCPSAENDSLDFMMWLPMQDGQVIS